jgi:ribosomal protein S18 acetylase RimI-like enzyme
MDTELYIREMQVEDLDEAMELKSAEGWNQTRSDWELILINNPALCLVAIAEDRVVATVTAFSYKGIFAWIGMMLVDRQFRRKGISNKLMLEIIKRLGKKQTIRLDATPAGQMVYERLGFVKEYSLFRWVRQPGVPEKARAMAAKVLQINHKDLQDLIIWDKVVFGAERKEVLSYLYTNYSQGAFCVKTGDKINGFVFCREGSKSMHIGPLITSEDIIAKTLINHMLCKFSDRNLLLDLGEQHSAMHNWLEENGFQRQRELIRMFIPPNSNRGIPENYYLISGPELG